MFNPFRTPSGFNACVEIFHSHTNAKIHLMSSKWVFPSVNDLKVFIHAITVNSMWPSLFKFRGGVRFGVRGWGVKYFGQVGFVSVDCCTLAGDQRRRFRFWDMVSDSHEEKVEEKC